jgi:Ca2+-binding EF-hand superfamily protein
MVNFEQFRAFLNKIGVQTKDSRSLIDLFSALDVNQECQLTKYDFEAVIVPLDPKYASLAFNHEVGSLTSTTINILREVFEELFLCRKSLESVKNTLKRENIDLNEVFNHLDVSNKGYLC